MGKSFEIKDPNSPASRSQTYAIYIITGVDIREIGLTKQQASDAIDMANDGKAYHVRKAAIEAGGQVKKRDVVKDHRNDPKPRGYATLNKEAMAEEEPEEEKPVEKKAKTKNVGLDWGKKKSTPKPKAKAKPKTKKPKDAPPPLGLEDIDWDDPKVQQVMAAFQAVNQ